MSSKASVIHAYRSAKRGADRIHHLYRMVLQKPGKYLLCEDLLPIVWQLRQKFVYTGLLHHSVCGLVKVDLVECWWHYQVGYPYHL